MKGKRKMSASHTGCTAGVNAGSSRPAKGARSSKVLALAAALAAPAFSALSASQALAAGVDSQSPYTLALEPGRAQQADAEQVPDQATRASRGPDGRPVYLADAVPEAKETPQIHGFVELPFKTSYITPRGLVVENGGVVFQPVAGLVFPIGDAGPVKGITFVTGVWNSINSAQGDPKVGPWNEFDYFASFSGNVGKVNATLTYGAWLFPTSTTNKPSTEHNLDLKISYDDTDLYGDTFGKGFALHPYVDVFWAISGSSTVVLGRQGDTGYVEIGIVPTYTYKEIHDYPITFTFPVYFSVGPEHYWGAANPDGNLGVFSASVNASVPLNFIPARYGYWHADAGVTYYHLINDNLLEAGRILSGNTDRDIVQGSVGIGVNF